MIPDDPEQETGETEAAQEPEKVLPEAKEKFFAQQQQQPQVQEAELDLDDDFGLVNDFASDLLDEGLLVDSGVDGLLSNDTLELSNVFNLEEALQLIDLDEAELQVCTDIT